MAARSAYEKVLDKEPANPEAMLRLGALTARDFDPLQQSGKDADARLVKAESLTTDPQIKFIALLSRGLIAEKRKDLALARARYEEARAINSEWSSARVALGSVFLQDGRTQAAKEMLPLETRPDTTDPWYGYSCRIMTPEARSELREWQARQGR